MVAIHHGAMQRDGRYWSDPDKFIPKRFYVADDDKESSMVTVDMGNMKVFGGGATMCKGRAFAEREVLAFAAAIIATWDIETRDGKWIHPGRRVASAAVMPKNDVRVRMRRRAH